MSKGLSPSNTGSSAEAAAAEGEVALQTHDPRVHPSEAYFNEHFHKIKGMSSLTAAMVCCTLLQEQTARRIRGAVAEIGVYEGRFFIGLALCTQAGEKCVAVDPFTWPDDRVAERFLSNCRHAGVDTERVVVAKTLSQGLSVTEFRGLANGWIRFIHIDGAHNYDAAVHDLQLAKPTLHAGGILCLDDVLHPQYPELTIAAGDFLKSSFDFQLFAIVDRESFAAACKYLICHKNYVDIFKTVLCTHFPELIMKQRARFFGQESLIVSTTRSQRG